MFSDDDYDGVEEVSLPLSFEVDDIYKVSEIDKVFTQTRDMFAVPLECEEKIKTYAKNTLGISYYDMPLVLHQKVFQLWQQKDKNPNYNKFITILSEYKNTFDSDELPHKIKCLIYSYLFFLGDEESEKMILNMAENNSFLQAEKVLEKYYRFAIDAESIAVDIYLYLKQICPSSSSNYSDVLKILLNKGRNALCNIRDNFPFSRENFVYLVNSLNSYLYDDVNTIKRLVDIIFVQEQVVFEVIDYIYDPEKDIENNKKLIDVFENNKIQGIRMIMGLLSEEKNEKNKEYIIRLEHIEKVYKRTTKRVEEIVLDEFSTLLPREFSESLMEDFDEFSGIKTVHPEQLLMDIQDKDADKYRYQRVGEMIESAEMLSMLSDERELIMAMPSGTERQNALRSFEEDKIYKRHDIMLSSAEVLKECGEGKGVYYYERIYEPISSKEADEEVREDREMISRINDSQLRNYELDKWREREYVRIIQSRNQLDIWKYLVEEQLKVLKTEGNDRKKSTKEFNNVICPKCSEELYYLGYKFDQTAMEKVLGQIKRGELDQMESEKEEKMPFIRFIAPPLVEEIPLGMGKKPDRELEESIYKSIGLIYTFFDAERRACRQEEALKRDGKKVKPKKTFVVYDTAQRHNYLNFTRPDKADSQSSQEYVKRRTEELNIDPNAIIDFLCTEKNLFTEKEIEKLHRKLNSKSAELIQFFQKQKGNYIAIIDRARNKQLLVEDIKLYLALKDGRYSEILLRAQEHKLTIHDVALFIAMKIGEKDREYYQQFIDNYNLQHVEVKTLEDIKHEKRYKAVEGEIKSILYGNEKLKKSLADDEFAAYLGISKKDLKEKIELVAEDSDSAFLVRNKLAKSIRKLLDDPDQKGEKIEGIFLACGISIRSIKKNLNVQDVMARSTKKILNKIFKKSRKYMDFTDRVMTEISEIKTEDPVEYSSKIKEILKSHIDSDKSIREVFEKHKTSESIIEKKLIDNYNGLIDKEVSNSIWGDYELKCGVRNTVNERFRKNAGIGIKDDEESEKMTEEEKIEICDGLSQYGLEVIVLHIYNLGSTLVHSDEIKNYRITNKLLSKKNYLDRIYQAIKDSGDIPEGLTKDNLPDLIKFFHAESFQAESLDENPVKDLYRYYLGRTPEEVFQANQVLFSHDIQTWMYFLSSHPNRQKAFLTNVIKPLLIGYYKFRYNETARRRLHEVSKVIRSWDDMIILVNATILGNEESRKLFVSEFGPYLSY